MFDFVSRMQTQLSQGRMGHITDWVLSTIWVHQKAQDTSRLVGQTSMTLSANLQALPICWFRRGPTNSAWKVSFSLMASFSNSVHQRFLWFLLRQGRVTFWPQLFAAAITVDALNMALLEVGVGIPGNGRLCHVIPVHSHPPGLPSLSSSLYSPPPYPNQMTAVHLPSSTRPRHVASEWMIWLQRSLGHSQEGLPPCSPMEVTSHSWWRTRKKFVLRLGLVYPHSPVSLTLCNSRK